MDIKCDTDKGEADIRRAALKAAGFWKTSTKTEWPVDARVQTVRLGAGDTLVLSSPTPLSKEGRDNICANIRDHLGHSGKVLVLDCGLTVQAVLQRDDPLDEAEVV